MADSSDGPEYADHFARTPVLGTLSSAALLVMEDGPRTTCALSDNSEGAGLESSDGLGISESLPAPLVVLPPDRVEESPISNIAFGNGAPSGLVQDSGLEPPCPASFSPSMDDQGFPQHFTELSVLGAGESLLGEDQLKNSKLAVIALESDLLNCSQTNIKDIYATKCPVEIFPVLLDQVTASKDLPNVSLKNIIPVNEAYPLQTGQTQISSIDSGINLNINLMQPISTPLIPLSDALIIHEDKTSKSAGVEVSPSSYSQAVSKITPAMNYGSSQPNLNVTKECAVFVERLANTNLDIYCRAFERQVGSEHLAYIGRAPGDPNKILAFVGSSRIAERLVHTGIIVRGRWLMVSFRSVPATRIVLSDVMPYINDDVLVTALAPFGEVATPKLRKIRAATSHSSFRKVFSFRREVYMYLSKDSVLPSKLNIDSEGEVHEIELSTNGVKCYRCGKFGHSITFCNVPKIVPHSSVGPSTKVASVVTDIILAKQGALEKQKSTDFVPFSVSSDLFNNSVLKAHSGPISGTSNVVSGETEQITCGNRGVWEVIPSDIRLQNHGGPQTAGVARQGIVSGGENIACKPGGTTDPAEMLVGDEEDVNGWKLVVHSNKRKRPVDLANGSPLSPVTDHTNDGLEHKTFSSSGTTIGPLKPDADPSGLVRSGIPKHRAYSPVSGKHSD